MFLIERYAKTPAKLFQKSRYIHDGKQAWVSQDVLVFENENSRLGQAESGRVQYGHVFFVPPLSADPVLPAQIECNGINHDVVEIKQYKCLAGKRMGYRLKVAGA